ncbi:MAG TPA: YetF domain-containing protein [Aggregatilineaceae bacterium]|nr:YetF domain-containing protein [Aggregatilineaceae bacterium]
MFTILRSTVVYLFLLLLFRLTGKRSLAQITSFDFILLLIISEAIQQAMLGEDSSMTNAFLIVITLVGLDVGMSLIKQRAPKIEKWMDGLPLILVEDGQPIQECMEKARVNEQDILSSAREKQGLERMDQIKYAVLERSGGISIIPKP